MSLPNKPFQWVANYTQMPNEFFEVAPYLTEPELRIMLYAIRHTIGWDEKRQSRSAHISMSNFANGYTLGDTHYEGTHLTEVTIRKGLIELVKLGLLEKVGDITPDGQKWHLPHRCNTSALEKRARDRYAKDQLRTINGRKKAEEKRLFEQGGYPITPDEGGLSHNGGEGLSHNPTEGYPITPNKEREKEEKEITTSDATHQSTGPILNPDEKDVRYPFVEQRLSVPFNGKIEIPAQAEKAPKQDATTAPTTPQPPTTPANELEPVPHEMAVAAAEDTGAKKGKGKTGFTREQLNAMAITLGDALGVPPVGKDFATYGNVVSDLIKATIPAEEFAAHVKFCRDEAEGRYKITVTALTSNGRPSRYVAQRNEKARELEAAQKLRDSIPPEYLPRIVPPEKRATPEQIAEALAAFNTPIFKASNVREDVS